MALLFTSEIKGIQAMDGQRKLAIPADAAKYHASRPPAVPGHGTAAYERFVGDLSCRGVGAKIGARGLSGVPRMLRSTLGSALRAARAQAP
jgi:hypothetical protein